MNKYGTKTSYYFIRTGMLELTAKKGMLDTARIQNNENRCSTLRSRHASYTQEGKVTLVSDGYFMYGRTVTYHSRTYSFSIS